MPEFSSWGDEVPEAFPNRGGQSDRVGRCKHHHHHHHHHKGWKPKIGAFMAIFNFNFAKKKLPFVEWYGLDRVR